MGILASGVGIAKVIGLLATPIITRIYSPADIGVLAVFTTVILLVVPLSTLFYSITIPLPKTAGIAINIVVLCSALIFTVTTILSISFFLFGDVIFGFFNMEEIAAYWWLLIIGIFAASFYDLMTHWATRTKSFVQVAKTKVWQASTAAIINIGLGLIGMKPLGLLIGVVSKKGGGVISLFRSFINDFKTNIPSVKIKRICFLLRYYVEFPIYRLPSQFIMKLSGQIPVLFFAYHFSQEETGQLGLSLSLIGLPLSLLGSSTGQAFYANVSRISTNNPVKIYEVTKSVIKRLILFSLLPFIILFTLSPMLFGFIFGNEWSVAGEFTSILSIYLLFQFMYSPIGNSIFNIYREQSKVFILNLLRVALIILVFFIAILIDLNPYNTLWFYAIVLSIYYILSTYIVFRVIKSNIT